MTEIKNLLEGIICAIIHYPESLTIEEEDIGEGIIYKIKVKKSDMGLLIGKQGNTSSAIKRIIRVAGFKNHTNIYINFIEPEL